MDTEQSIIKISIDKLIPNKYQPRKYFDEDSLDELAKSIKNYGILNPILARKKDDKYEIIAGERRYRAAKKIGMTEVPVIIKNTDEQQTAELALIENLERQDLTAIEAARSYEEIIKLGGHTQSELANKLGISQSALANKMRLLTLPNEIQDAVIKKQISERHARSLLNVEDKETQLKILKRIIDEKLTVKETEEIIELETINDEDIAQAINDIMTSLNIKEEKESDIMNNGNFFPNYDNNMNQNNNMLNNNMQGTPMPAQPENVMPTMATNPQFAPIDNTMASPVPQEAPLFGGTPALEPNMAPSFGETSMPTMNEPVVQEAPLFGGAPAPEPNMAPSFGETPMPTMNEPVVEETPLFGGVPEVNPIPPLFDQPATLNNSTYEVPVMQNQSDKSVELENYLNSQGIGYKKYSNETGKCIIIEL